MNLLENLKTEKNQLLARLSQLEMLMAKYVDLERQAREILAVKPQDNVSATPPIPHKLRESSDSSRRTTSPGLQEFERVTRQILGEATGPIERGDLLNKLEARGVKIVLILYLEFFRTFS